MNEYLFDLTILAAIRVKAKDEATARGMIREALDCASINAGCWPNGDPIVFEGSLDTEEPFELVEINGECDYGEEGEP